MNTSILTQKQAVVWQRVVVSKTGADHHVVTRYQDDRTDCRNCKGFNYRGTCSHIAIAEAQQAREQVNWNSWLTSQGLDLVDEGPVPFDEPAPATDHKTDLAEFDAWLWGELANQPETTEAEQKAETKRQGAAAFADLFGA